MAHFIKNGSRVSLVIGSLAAAAMAHAAVPPGEAGLDLLDQIDAAFALKGEYAGLYAEHPGRPTPGPVWPLGMLLDAKLAAARVDPEKLPDALALIDALERYRVHVVNGHRAYIAEFHQPSQHYFDDNAWLVLSLLDAYDLSKQPALLEGARETLAFVLSGEDKDRGGIYWMHEERESRNACSVGPAVVACLRLHAITNDPALLETALRLRAWNEATLRDEADGLYLDNIRVRGDGGSEINREINRAKWTYNSALPLIADVELYRLTKEAAYLDDARRIAVAGLAHWHDEATGAVRCDAQFVRWWIEALAELSGVDADPRWDRARARAVEWVLSTAPHDPPPPAAFYPKRFEAPEAVAAKDANLNDQAARARILIAAGAAAGRRE